MKVEKADMWKPFYVAGVQFHELDKVASRLTEGSELNMVEEHDNKYDPYAVALYFDNVQVGYVPKSISHLVTNALYEYHIICKVQFVYMEAKPWNRLNVQIERADVNAVELDELDMDEAV